MCGYPCHWILLPVAAVLLIPTVTTAQHALGRVSRVPGARPPSVQLLGFAARLVRRWPLTPCSVSATLLRSVRTACRHTCRRESLSDVDLNTELERRVYTLQSPPCQLREVLLNALRAGSEGAQTGNTPQALFFLAPRRLLFRVPGTTHLAHEELTEGCPKRSSADVGKAVKKACSEGPDCDSESARARDARSKALASSTAASSSRTREAKRCQPRVISGDSPGSGSGWCRQESGPCGWKPQAIIID